MESRPWEMCLTGSTNEGSDKMMRSHDTVPAHSSRSHSPYEAGAFA